MNLDLMVFFQDNLPRIKDGAYVINLDDKDSKGTHWVPLFIERNLAVYFEFFWNWIHSSRRIKQN